MSSTNRSDARNTHISDFYVTPPDCIKEFFSYWLDDLMGEFHDDQLEVGTRPDRAIWFDPCAGGDATHTMSYPKVIKEELGAETVMTNDIRLDSLAEEHQDYILYDTKQWEEKYRPDVIITNPPFNIAEAIINKALQDVKEGGYVVMLLRLNFFGSNQRFPFWKKQLPTWAYVHHRRMSFTDDGKTDSIEYCHMVWQRGAQPSFVMTKVI